jgi:hypothetical protein
MGRLRHREAASAMIVVVAVLVIMIMLKACSCATWHSSIHGPSIIFSGLWLHMKQESEKPNSSAITNGFHALKVITVRSNHQDTYALRKGDNNFSRSYLAGSLPRCLRSRVLTPGPQRWRRMAPNQGSWARASSLVVTFRKLCVASPHIISTPLFLTLETLSHIEQPSDRSLGIGRAILMVDNKSFVGK